MGDWEGGMDGLGEVYIDWVELESRLGGGNNSKEDKGWETWGRSGS